MIGGNDEIVHRSASTRVNSLYSRSSRGHFVVGINDARRMRGDRSIAAGQKAAVAGRAGTTDR